MFFKALQCVPIFQENEDIQDCGSYRDIMPLRFGKE